MKRGRLVSFCVALATALGSSTAFGYCRTSTCGSQIADDCAEAPKCPSGGVVLYWPGREMSIEIENGSVKRGISPETARDVLSRAMAAWTSADCGGGGPSVVISSIDVTSEAVPAKTVWRREATSDAVNALRFLDDQWPHDPSAIALTTVRYGTSSGKIFAADIEANSLSHDMTVVDSGGDFDLQSILTHESGHFFGLSHVVERTATMYASYPGGGNIERRTLGSNDREGICAVYPHDRFDDASGCKCSVGRERRSSPVSLLLLAAACCALRRRTRTSA
jgi:Matrixin